MYSMYTVQICSYHYNHLVYCPVLPNIVCMCTVQFALAAQKSSRYFKKTRVYSDINHNIVINTKCRSIHNV